MQFSNVQGSNKPVELNLEVQQLKELEMMKQNLTQVIDQLQKHLKESIVDLEVVQNQQDGQMNQFVYHEVQDPVVVPLNLTPLNAKINEGRWGDDSTILVLEVPEDSIFRKLAACIPVIGIYFSVTNQRSLVKKITTWEGNKTKAALIYVKNHYKVASIVRNILSVALVTSTVALSSLVPVVIPLAMVSNTCKAYAIYKNRQLSKELQNTEEPIENLDRKLM